MTLHRETLRMVSSHVSSDFLARPIGGHHPMMTMSPSLPGRNPSIPLTSLSRILRFSSDASPRLPMIGLARAGARSPIQATTRSDSR